MPKLALGQLSAKSIATQQGIAIKTLLTPIEAKQVVGLGEGTHGTKEFNDIRVAIIQELVLQKGFNIICLESAYGGGYWLNQIINSNEDIKQAMKQHLTSIWQTQEIEALLLWMRQYNQTHNKPITLMGMDWNYIGGSGKIVKEFCEKIGTLKIYANQLEQCTLRQDTAWEKQNDTTAVLNMADIILNASEGYTLTVKIDSIMNTKHEYPLALKNALLNCKHGFYVLYQAGKKQEALSRDAMMADMVLAVLNQQPNAKMAIMAHNGHVAYKASEYLQGDANPGGMGYFLRKKIGKSYYAIGTTTAKGTYSATTDFVDTHTNQFRPYRLNNPISTSWEAYFAQQKSSIFWIDAGAGLLKNKKKSFRFIGYRPENQDSYTEEASFDTYFDAMLFFRETTAARHLF